MAPTPEQIGQKIQTIIQEAIAPRATLSQSLREAAKMLDAGQYPADSDKTLEETQRLINTRNGLKNIGTRIRWVIEEEYKLAGLDPNTDIKGLRIFGPNELDPFQIQKAEVLGKKRAVRHGSRARRVTSPETGSITPKPSLILKNPLAELELAGRMQRNVDILSKDPLFIEAGYDSAEELFSQLYESAERIADGRGEKPVSKTESGKAVTLTNVTLDHLRVAGARGWHSLRNSPTHVSWGILTHALAGSDRNGRERLIGNLKPTLYDGDGETRLVLGKQIPTAITPKK